ncbi:MAG: 30S ribosomal protein S4 [Patescibacteria group bacterium]
MGRNLSPQCKQCRREGEKLFLKGERCNTSKCAMIKRNFVPGMHGSKGKPRLSGYGIQLREKQKAKKLYGLLEKQFSNYYVTATKKAGNTADNFFNLLEHRLDTIVYRAGLASSRRLARQLVNHGHILVNGRRCNIPSCQIKKSDKVAVKESFIKKSHWQEILKTIEKVEIPEWIQVDKTNLQIVIKGEPNIAELHKTISMSLIIEYYSR